MQVIVIGASHAGIDFVDSMRRHGFAGELTVIERLPGQPLERPPLSKTFIQASDDEDEVRPAHAGLVCGPSGDPDVWTRGCFDRCRVAPHYA